MPGSLSKLTVGTLMLLILLILAAPQAIAKGGPENQPVAVITISRPGLDRPILVNGDLAWHVLYLTTFRGVGLGVPEPPSDGLGRVLEARYRFVQPNGNIQTLRQELYPCASDGRVWAFTPSGQDRVRLRIGPVVQSGWWHSVALSGAIEDLRSACDRLATAAGVTTTGTGMLTGIWAGLGALAFLATIALLWLAGRRRSRSVPA